ncbi:MAG TPA: malate synthase A [Bacteroidota bacterium]|jgi:malate synthase
MKTLTKQETAIRLPGRVEISAPPRPEFSRVLTPDALAFVAGLEREFGQRRKLLLLKRWERQVDIIAGKLPDFLQGTANIRKGDWKVAPIKKDLLDRRVEITAPTDRKMIINALNSGSNVFIADFEDANSPTWTNIVRGQLNVIEAVDRTISFRSPEGKEYRLKDEIATLMVRPRGWHMEEKHVTVDGSPVSAALFDFGLFMFHNGRALTERGSGPYFYLPKMESHLEARLWNDVFVMAQEKLGLPAGTIRATALIETVPAAFEMDEILYELRDHSAGLNCGRWDYLFSMIKKFRHYPEFVLADRSRLAMSTRFLHSYSLALIRTCHNRGAHAMGGMAAHIPVKGDQRLNEEAIARVRADKMREAEDGHDGTWVAHPGLVAVAKDVFDAYMPGPNQIHRKREDVNISAADLLTVPKPVITEQGMRVNIRVALEYFESWLRGIGCVPINNLMEDAATAEISRAQLWQWLHHQTTHLSSGGKITLDLYRKIVTEELAGLLSESVPGESDQRKFRLAAELLDKLVVGRMFSEFFTSIAYTYLE